MDRGELDSLKQEQQRRMLRSSESGNVEHVFWEFIGTAAVTEVIFQPGLVIAGIVGAVATAGIEFVQSRRHAGE